MCDNIEVINQIQKNEWINSNNEGEWIRENIRDNLKDSMFFKNVKEEVLGIL